MRVYTDPACAGAIAATGSAADFAAAGLGATVAPNSETTFRATATDQSGNASPCSTASAVYHHDQDPPAAPTLTGSSPASPANDDSPRLAGTAEAGSTVRIYRTADCSGAPDASGSAADLAAPGIEVTVPAGTTASFRATATDATGNTSPCSGSALSYENRPPAAAAPAAEASRAGERPHAQVTVTGRVALWRGRPRPRLLTRIVVSCPAGVPVSCGGSGRVSASVPGRLAARTYTIGKLGFAVRPGQSRRIVIHLTPRGARIVERVRRIRVTIRLTTRGRNGARVVTSRRVTLRIR